MIEQAVTHSAWSAPAAVGPKDVLASVMPSDSDHSRQVICRYLALRCMDLTPFEVLGLLLREGEDPGRILKAVGLMADRTWDRLELLVGLWLKRPGLQGLRKQSSHLGIHPVSLPLFLPEMAHYLPALTEGPSKGILSCRLNDLVLSLADALGVRVTLRDFQQGLPPGFLPREVELRGPGCSRAFLPGLKFRHSLSIKGDPSLDAIPSQIEVGESLKVRDCPSLRIVPRDLRVGRHLHLQMLPNLQKVPENLRIKGHLEISGSGALDALPRKIQCTGDFRLEVDLAAAEEWDELQVKGSARISGEHIASLPRGTRIEGRLQLIDLPHLESLPEGLWVGRDLIIRGCPALRHHGLGLQVGGMVHLEIPCPLWHNLVASSELADRILISHVDRTRI